MKLAILSRKSSIYSTHRLKVAAEERGHEVVVIDYLRCYMNIASHRPQILFQGAKLEGFDAIIPRIGASKTFYGTAVVRQFEMMGVYSLNGSQALSRSRDKLRGLQLLARKGIGMPITGFAHSTKDIEGLISIVGGPPLVVKILEGTRGLGVVLAETEQAATSVIEAFRGLETNILVQELIRESVGTDIRCLVVGDRVKAAVLRRGNPNDLGPRLHRGTRLESVKLEPEERTTAVRAAQAMGLRVAGVDLLRSARGPLVIGVAASPALERVEQATGTNVAGAIVEFVEKDMKTRKTTGDRIKH